MSSYHERQKNLFNHLKNAEEQCKFSQTNKAEPPVDYGAIDKQTYRHIKNKMRQFRGKESIYKKHASSLSSCLRPKSIPDFVKNPQKWEYYSLSDVTADQMSDATNTATALAIIQKLEENAQSTDETTTSEVLDDEVIFKKPTFRPSVVIKPKTNTDDKPLLLDKKVVMPEYVVGVTQKKDKKQKVVQKVNKLNVTEKSELKLKHLYDEDDE